MYFEEVIVPIAICVVLPVCIVWIVSEKNKHAINRKTEVMLKAIESGEKIDPNLFTPKREKRAVLKRDLLDRFTGACVTGFMGTAFLILGILNVKFFHGQPEYMSIASGAILLSIGIALLISYFVAKKTLAEELKAEQKNFEK